MQQSSLQRPKVPIRNSLNKCIYRKQALHIVHPKSCLSEQNSKAKYLFQVSK